MASPVAIVTGAASGMGLALTKHLVAKGWKVGMADVNAAAGEKHSADLGPNAFFRTVDIINYAEQAAFFDEVWRWGGGRLDFLAANAGIGDAQSIYSAEQHVDMRGIPVALNTRALGVMVEAVMQGIWLFKYYSRRDGGRGGKVVITASTAGLYPFYSQPQYTAAKHALVGLTRSAGPSLKQEGIYVNAVCPGFVATSLLPQWMHEHWPKEHLTPITAIIRAFDTFLENNELAGRILELSGQEEFFRKPVEYSNETQRWTYEDSWFRKFDPTKARL